MSNLGGRSEKALLGVKPELISVVRLAHEKLQGNDNGVSFIVTEGLRNVTRQAELVRAGASRTMNSKHMTGDAVDLAATINGEVRWDWPLYGLLYQAMQDAAD